MVVNSEMKLIVVAIFVAIVVGERDEMIGTTESAEQ